MNTAANIPAGVLELFRLDGRAAVVTGAARGLGRAMALALAEAGADIIAIDTAPLEELAQDVEDRGVRCAAREADLSRTDPETAAGLVDWCHRTFDGVSLLVNNAGLIRRGPALETPQEDWDAVLGLNLTAPFFLAQAFARSLYDTSATGSVINIASVNSFQGGTEVPAYAASKHGVLGITRALANEWSRHGIRVNAIAPGYMATDFTRAHREDPGRAAAMLNRIPADRWGTPDDLAGAVVFLASSAAGYVTGTALTVDGGWLAR